jgi:RND family efflux transporter MFP subunit
MNATARAPLAPRPWPPGTPQGPPGADVPSEPESQAAPAAHVLTPEILPAAVEPIPVSDRHAVVLDLLAVALAPDRLVASAQALATELAVRLGMERVSVGMVERGRCAAIALSHSARFAEKADLIRDVEGAMNEALDQADTIVYPLPDHRPARVTWAHAELSRRQGTGGVVTAIMTGRGRVVGAITAEQPGGEAFADLAVEVLEVTAALLGPILELRRRDERLLLARAWESLRLGLRELLALRRPSQLLVGLGLASLVAFLALATGELRVSAEARLEGEVQQSLAAPMSGFIGTATARAGDLVRAGDVLATLDDRDLQLERVKWTSRRSQLSKEYHAALATHDQSKVAILKAQVDQATAQIELLDEQLTRTRLTAPFDGVVVNGDLSQSLGAPVERGQQLLQVAPLDAYRVVLEVDERDLAHVAVGHQGQLGLTALPGRTFPVAVTKITPVAQAKDGRNVFRVEARLDAQGTQLRPGMEGVAKVDAGRYRLVWAWTRRLTDWLAVALWAHWP